MDLQLQNKVILVTGAVKGIGERIANVLADEGVIFSSVGQQADDQRVGGVTDDFRKAVITVLG